MLNIGADILEYWISETFHNESESNGLLDKNIKYKGLKEFPRAFRNVSNDKAFLKFQKYSAPLQSKKISLIIQRKRNPLFKSI